MYNIKLLILAISLLTVCITFYNLFFYKKPQRLEEKLINNQKSIETTPEAENSQSNYEKKNKFLDVFKNKIKNKLELSWQFLYDITDIVLKRFSSQDREETSRIGKVLFRAGMRYNHVVEYGINLDKIKIEKEQNKNLEI